MRPYKNQGFSRRPSTPSNDNFCFGLRPVQEALDAGKEIDKLLVQTGLKSEGIQEVLEKAAAANVPISKVPVEKLNNVTRKLHQGVIAYLSAIEYASLDNVISECYQKGEMPLILLLDRVTDVRNFGAISRTAECLGVHAIVTPAKGGAMIGPDALKTSAGALNYIPVCRVPNLKKTVEFLQDSGLRAVACTEKASNTLFEVEMKGPLAIIMGSEEDGISDDLIRITDEMVKIPMVGKVSSLNVSVATGMILSESIRQRVLEQ
ncbi:23S rRNA (guanosine(2251)-2'-O)-methyltransferase RlmB [Flammeovirgaceae bacterium SG7u.111]|nr:23S rRNA (guanosine(2251)-2'-O)-methyltransferase RlmB [Flammeovirgaceae bacterium SG7u.132]WPO36447.1 23S rRNA (guanosine(2251)-2'-O)-methyltransferase RlmB [Flammeovirgaceae bacterium SG7u.111]